MITDVETQLKYGIVDTKDIYPMLYRETDVELHNHSTFSAAGMPYEYRNWLTGEGYENYVWDNNLTDMQYDKSIIIDLHSDGNWMHIFEEGENHFVHLMKRVVELFHTVVNDTYDSARIVREHHEQLGYHDWCSEVDYDDYHMLRPSQVSSNGYRNESASPVVSILSRTFRVQSYQYPTGVELDIDSMNYVKHRMFMAVKAAKFWSTMPMRYLVIPLPSETYIEFMESQGSHDTFQEKDYLWGNDSLRLYLSLIHI